MFISEVSSRSSKKASDRANEVEFSETAGSCVSRCRDGYRFVMDDFFEPPPAPVVAEPQRYRMPPWFGPPRGTIPGIVAFERILAQTDRVAICTTRLAAYPHRI